MATQNKMNLQTAPIRTYLDSTVVPILLQAQPRSPRSTRARDASPRPRTRARATSSPRPRHNSPKLRRGAACVRRAPMLSTEVLLPPLSPSQGLSALVKERPANPVEFLAAYLMQNNPQKA